MLKKTSTTTYSLGSIMAFRMLGLFMILPVFAVQATSLTGANAHLIGLALGVYGLTQALLQIPFGMLSDHIGRKPIIAAGLLLFALGSVIAAMSHNIYGVIIGRAIQGAGAIGSTVLAFVADLTRDESRLKAMATIGLIIGSTFSLAMVLGPLFNSWFGLAGIFWSTAVLALIGILILFTVTPKQPKLVIHQDVEVAPKRLALIFQNPELLRLNFGIFALHAMLTSLFLIIPVLLTHRFTFSESQQAWFYLAVLVTAFLLMLPFIIIAEKKRLMKPVFVGAIATLVLIQLLLIPFHQQLLAIGGLLLLFFIAFNLLEASLPSLVSKITSIHNKGTAMGVYSSSQFFGIFIGGVAGGFLFSHFSVNGILSFNVLLAAVWWVLAFTMRQPPYLSTLILPIKNLTKDHTKVQQQLNAISGIAEVVSETNEDLIYVKYDKKLISKEQIKENLAAE